MVAAGSVMEDGNVRAVAEQQGALDECNAPWTTLLEQLADSSFVSEARAATLRAIADHLSCVRTSTSQVAPQPQAGEPVAWESPGEWELEQRAFHGANNQDAPEWARTLIADLWKQYCAAASPQPANPAQVTDAEERGRQIYRNRLGKKLDEWKLEHVPAAAIGAGGKVVAYLHETEYGDRDLSFEPAFNHHQWSSIPLYASPQPANPAQVTDAMVAEAAKSLGHEGVYISYETIRRALTAAIGAGGQAVAEAREHDIKELIKLAGERQLVDGVALYDRSLLKSLANVLEETLSQPHPADDRVVEDTWFTDRTLPVRAMSGDVEDNRVLRLHFRRPVTDDDRKAMCDALNLHQASLAHPLPLKDEMERVAAEQLYEFVRTKGIHGPEAKPWSARSTEHQQLWIEAARALLSRLRAGEQEGWKPIETAPKDGTRVLTFAPEIAGDLYPFTGRPHAAIIVNKWRGTSWWHSRQDQQPTHWQPIPAAPSEQGGDRG